MVERRILTGDFVDEVSPPSKGERWIADTKVKGFGLRLWATKGGGQKSLAIRASDENGRSVRVTFDPYSSRTYRTDLSLDKLLGRQHHRFRLGSFLSEARYWAKAEIDFIKGKPFDSSEYELRQESAANREEVAQRVRNLSLEKAAESVIKGLEINGSSESYRDSLFRIFHSFVPSEMKSANLEEITPAALAEAISNPEIRFGNLRTLRTFLGRVFREAGGFCVELQHFSDEFAEVFWPKWQDKCEGEVPYPALMEWTRSHYEEIFALLEKEEQYWQQAFCIRLYFAFGVPLTGLMRAQWTQICDGSWFPYQPHERNYWYVYRTPIDEKPKQILDEVALRVKQSFPGSRYWFPSSHGRKFGHIRSVDTVWHQTLNKIGAGYFPLRDAAMRWRPENKPSHNMYIVKRYGHIILEGINMAKLSRNWAKQNETP